VVLPKDRHAFAGLNGNVTSGGIQVTGEDLQESRLTGTVCTNDAIAVAVDEFEVHLVKEHPFAKLKGYVISSNHAVFKK
jgi:hypothetical protein